MKKHLILKIIKKNKINIILLVVCLLLIFISFHQINEKGERYIKYRSQKIVEDLQKRLGFNIQWKDLDFTAQSFSISLTDVTLSHTPSSQKTKSPLARFLNKDQTIKSIVIRPSLLSFIFKRSIMISKVEIEQGELSLKTIPQIKKIKAQKTDFIFPIKKIIIKDTNLTLKHQDHTLKFLEISSTLNKKTFNNYALKISVEKTFLNQEPPFSLKANGLIKKNKLAFKKIELKNESLDIKDTILSVDFNSQKVQNIRIKSSGTLPFSLVNEVRSLFNQEELDLQALISYDLDLKFNKKHKYKGTFQVKSKDFTFQNINYQNLLAQGRLVNNLALIDSGSIKTHKGFAVNIKKAEFLFSKDPIKYNISLNTQKLDTDFIQDFLQASLPVQGFFSGSAHCTGDIDQNHVTCQTQTHFKKLDIQDVVSLFNPTLKTKIELKNNLLFLNIAGRFQSKDTVFLNGTYNLLTSHFTGDLEGRRLNLPKQVYFHTDTPIEGLSHIKKGRIEYKNDNFTMQGNLVAPILSVNKYNLQNISSFFEYKEDQLSFLNIEGLPGKSNYKGSFVMNFQKRISTLQAQFSFLDLKDVKYFSQNNIQWPFQIKGTGTAQLIIKIPWGEGVQNSFSISGNLFNAFIEKEFFQRISFSLSSLNGQGVINHASFSKGFGSILVSGIFTENFNLNLSLKGQNLSLESLSFLNSLLPFHQSGVLNFDMNLKGTLKDPKAKGGFKISEASLYSFPVEDTSGQITIDKHGVSLSGNAMNQLTVDHFYYSFNQQKQTQIVGTFTNFDFVKFFSAKYQKDFIESYRSGLKGGLKLSIDPHQGHWTGVVNIDRIFISKGKKWLRNISKFSLEFSDNLWLIHPVTFTQHDKSKVVIQKQGKKLQFSGQTSLFFFNLLFPYFTKLDGDVEFDLMGNSNLKKWNPKGELKIKNGLFTIATLPDFSNITSQLLLDGSQIHIQEFKSSVGNGFGEGKGSVTYDFKRPPLVDVLLNFSDVKVNFPTDFVTKGSGFIQVKGDQFPYLLKGDYFIQSGEITKNFSDADSGLNVNYTSLDQKEAQKSSHFRLSLSLKTQNPISISNSILNSLIKGYAYIFGPLDLPLISGKFDIVHKEDKEDSNFIFFKGHDFKITSGTVNFKSSAPANPSINVQAETLFTEKFIDDLENTNQEKTNEYKIFLTVSGLVEDLNFALESTPNLDEKEIISMLTLGVGTRYFDANLKENITGYSYHLLGSLLLQRSLNKEFKDTLGLNFGITPHINILNQPVPKVIIKKVWFDKIKTSFSRTIEEFPENDARVKYSLTQNTSLTAFWGSIEHIQVDFREKENVGIDFEFDFNF